VHRRAGESRGPIRRVAAASGVRSPRVSDPVVSRADAAYHRPALDATELRETRNPGDSQGCVGNWVASRDGVRRVTESRREQSSAAAFMDPRQLGRPAGGSCGARLDAEE
jgi:hypothetical protein